MSTAAPSVIPIGKPVLGEREVEAGRRVILSGWVTQAHVGAPHAVAVSNCTTALHLALLAFAVRAGDEQQSVTALLEPEVVHNWMATAAVGDVD